MHWFDNLSTVFDLDFNYERDVNARCPTNNAPGDEQGQMQRILGMKCAEDHRTNRVLSAALHTVFRDCEVQMQNVTWIDAFSISGKVAE